MCLLRIADICRWLFDHPERANGMDLEVAIDDVAYADLAATFEKVTGHPARYIDTDLDTTGRTRRMPGSTPAGYNAEPK